MKTDCHQCPTRRWCLAAGLDAEALDAIAQCVRPSCPIRRGMYLYSAGDAANCFVVRSGAFKTFVTSADGEEYVTGFHFPGELIGLAGHATGITSESAVALETSTVCRVPLREMPRLWSIGGGMPLLRLMGQSEQLGSESHTNLSRHSAVARVAGFLLGLGRRLRLPSRDPDFLPLPMSRTDLANHLGMTLECLSRVISRFGRDGLISATRTGIFCHDNAGLATLAGHVDR